MRFDEIQGRNMLYVAMRRVSLIIGVLVIAALMIQNAMTAAVAECEVQTLRLAYGKEVMVVDQETGELVGTGEYIYPNLTLPTKDDFGRYIYRQFQPKWKHPFRVVSGVFLKGSLDKHNWSVNLVSDMALRRLWMIVVAFVTLMIYGVAGVKYNKMKKDVIEQKGTDIIIKDYVRLCDKRAVVYVVLLAIAVLLSVKTKHNLFWLILTAVGVLVAELVYFYKFAAKTDAFNAGRKRSKWVVFLTWGVWGTATTAVVEFFRKHFHVAGAVFKKIISWPVRGVFKLVGESYEDYNKQQSAQQRREEGNPGTGKLS